MADPTKSASASLTIVPVVAVTVSPPNASVLTGTTQQFNASVTGTSSTPVAWNVTGAGCSGAACGTINSSGLYTAPAVAPSPATVTITATSVADPTKSGAVNLTILGSIKIGPALPTLPQATVDLTMPTLTGTVRNVPAGNATAFQTAINNSTCGDKIVLAAGSTYSGNFTIPATSCSGWIVIQSSALPSLPAPGNRVSPSNAANMAVISTPNVSPAIAFLPSSNHWRLIGVEVTTSYSNPSNPIYWLVGMGFQSNNSTSITVQSQLPNQIIFDRSYIYGSTVVPIQHGINANTQAFGIVDSYCDEIVDSGADSQCVASWNGSGPFLIQNNFLQATGENIMFGGADPTITNLVPSDITIVGNLIQKNLAWKGIISGVKNLLELKNAQRVLVDGNVLQYTWSAAQAQAIILRSVNQGGTCPWCVVQNITVTHNLIQHMPIGVAISACQGPESTNPCVSTNTMLIQNNVLSDSSSATWGGHGWGFVIGSNSTMPPMNALTIDHNTVFTTDAALVLGDSGTTTNFQYTNNISDLGTYGILGTSVGSGTIGLTKYAPGYTYSDIVFTATATGTYPSGTEWAGSISGVGFTSAMGTDPNISGNLQLTSGSAYHNAGTDGKDIGVWDWTTFDTDTSNALNGIFAIN